MLLLTKLIRAVANLMCTCTSFLRYTRSKFGGSASWQRGLSLTTHCAYPEGPNAAVAAVEK